MGAAGIAAGARGREGRGGAEELVRSPWGVYLGGWVG